MVVQTGELCVSSLLRYLKMMRPLSLSTTFDELAQSNKNFKMSGQVLLPLSSSMNTKHVMINNGFPIQSMIVQNFDYDFTPSTI